MISTRCERGSITRTYMHCREVFTIAIAPASFETSKCSSPLLLGVQLHRGLILEQARKRGRRPTMARQPCVIAALHDERGEPDQRGGDGSRSVIVTHTAASSPLASCSSFRLRSIR